MTTEQTDRFILRATTDVTTRILNCLDCGGDLTISPLLVGESATCVQCRAVWQFTRREEP